MKKSNISDRVVEFVLNCSNEDFQSLTISKMARQFNVNRCYLSRKFKKDKEFTICEFVVREKLFRSIEILKEDPQVTIKEISEKLGFANSNYFCRIFKRHFGTTPGRYRECVSRKLSGDDT
ncbi:MAG TPA: AraC family transcriptional regulator [Candidatus Deferrimicrobium sp.]|nr:AraC family transcriptional regulator [Candidatus Kapabacteria bacterium]HLP61059.1 AraC family transcriptional regulator [Candidatus Deferrimicrobium sp.]